MINLESIKISIDSLKSNKMRLLLTMLGVIIGVMSIVLLISVIAGTRAKIESEIKSIGSNVFMVFPGNLEETQGPPGSFAVNKLKIRDAEIMETRSGYGVISAPVFMTMGETVKYKDRVKTTTMVAGTNEKFSEIRNWNVATGKFFRKEDIESARRIAVIGDTVVRTLFGGTNPIGKDITIAGKKFMVIGITEKKGSTFGQDSDDIAAIPITAAHELFGTTKVNQILLKVPDEQNLARAILETKRLLLHKMDKEDFSVSSQGELLQMFSNFANILSVVTACVAGISLLVGGIGIMNIMLVTVKERTREIGIRKAVGATFRDILAQFIVESIIISVFGGLIGILLSVAIVTAVSPFLPFPLKASMFAIITSFCFSACIGIFFGTYPAIKAAKIDPILALRYE